MPLYSIDYINNDTDTATYRYFYTTRAARNFLYNNRNKIHDVIIYLFRSMTEISEKDLRD
jgi:hypothetical protein